jgi:hypothetical protein
MGAMFSFHTFHVEKKKWCVVRWCWCLLVVKEEKLKRGGYEKVNRGKGRLRMLKGREGSHRKGRGEGKGRLLLEASMNGRNPFIQFIKSRSRSMIGKKAEPGMVVAW